MAADLVSVVDVNMSDAFEVFKYKWSREYATLISRVQSIFRHLRAAISSGTLINTKLQLANKDVKENELGKDDPDLIRMRAELETLDLEKDTFDTTNKAGLARKQKAIQDIKTKIKVKEAKYKADNKTKMSVAAYPMTGNYESAIMQVKEAVRMYVNALTSAADAALPLLSASGDRNQRARALLNAVDLRLLSAFAEGDSDLLAAFQSERDFIKDLPEDANTHAKKIAASNKLELIQVSALQSMSAFVDVLREKHEKIAMMITSGVTGPGAVLQSMNILPLYALKAMRIATAYAASFVAARLFENAYVNAMATNKPVAPDLKWLVVVYFIFIALFDGALVLMMWLLKRLELGDINPNIIKDFMVDTFVANALALASLMWMADVVQDRRYFDYQLTAPRAVRVMRQLCFAVSGVHALVPYFYFTGPFYYHQQMAAEAKLEPR